ncbi:MAG: hypothetical protein ACRDT4_02365 [Micromonosporaceae bacterium]
MASAHTHNELHRLSDQLTPAQADAVRAVALELVKKASRQDGDRPSEESHRKLSYAGVDERRA